jgi:hypothetical protein
LNARKIVGILERWFVTSVWKQQKGWKLEIAAWENDGKGEGDCGERCVPPPRGVLYEYQNKRVVGGGFCMNVKRKKLWNSGRRKGRRRRVFREKWGRTVRMELDYTRQYSMESFTKSRDILSVFESI